MLLEFVDDGFHAFLELSAVFGAGDEGGEVEGEEAFAVEGARDTTFGDADGESFGNGAFADAAFTDEDGVVLFAAGEDLCYAVHLFLSSDDGVEFAFLGELGEVAAEVFEGGGAAFAFVALGFLLAAFDEGVGPCVVVVVVGGLAGEVGRASGLEAAVGADELGEAFVVDVLFSEEVGDEVVVFLQHGEDEVLGADFGGFEFDAFEVAEAEYLLGLAEHGYFAVFGVADVGLSLRDLVFEALAEGGGVDAEGGEHGHCRAFGEASHAEEEVLDGDAAVFEADGFVAGEGDGLFCIFTKVCFHVGMISGCKITTNIPNATSVPKILINKKVWKSVFSV